MTGKIIRSHKKPDREEQEGGGGGGGGGRGGGGEGGGGEKGTKILRQEKKGTKLILMTILTTANLNKLFSLILFFSFPIHFSQKKTHKK